MKKDFTRIPRGVRNNNPGNIRISNQPWVGKVVNNTDSVFEQFDTAEFGIRAICRIIATYLKKDINTITLIINRWAPPHENDTDKYINFVCDTTGLGPNETVRYNVSHVNPLLKAIITMENGIKFRNYYSDETLFQAMQLANVGGTK